VKHLAKSNLDELLSNYGVIDAVSWQPPANMTYDQWTDVGERFRYIDSAKNWWLGDWINEGENRWGDKYTQAIEVTGNTLQNLMNYSYTSRNVHFSVRTEKLSWTHHWHVAKFDEDTQRSLLSYAIDHNLSSRDLLESAREYEANLKQIQPVEDTTVEPQFDNPERNAPRTNGTHDSGDTYDQEAEALAEDGGNYDGGEYNDDPWAFSPVIVGVSGNYKQRGDTKQCGVCSKLWIADLPYCPYCNISPDVRAHESSKPHVANNSGNNEWYTPREYVESARRVLGRIDLDPATSEIANTIVQAGEFYTVDDDGLTQEWTGKVWMNPPYSSDLVGRFSKKLCNHYQAGDVTEAIVLVNNATETAWFQRMARMATCVCFPKSRVRFWRPDGETGAPLQGQAILYFGTKKSDFSDEFRSFGFVGVIRG